MSIFAHAKDKRYGEVALGDGDARKVIYAGILNPITVAMFQAQYPAGVLRIYTTIPPAEVSKAFPAILAREMINRKTKWHPSPKLLQSAAVKTTPSLERAKPTLRIVK